MGGGGSAGEVDYPQYMKDAHEAWLTALSALVGGASPYAAQVAYDPDTDLAASDAAVAALAALLAGITDVTSWAALFTQAGTSIGVTPTYTIADMAAVTVGAVADITAGTVVVADMTDTTDVGEIVEATIVADIAAFADVLDDNVEANILPRYRRGMQDIGAVVSSAFPIGEAIIEAMQARDVAKYGTELRLKSAFRNSEIGIENERLHLDVKKANLAKNLEVGLTNAKLQLEADKSNLQKSTELVVKTSDMDFGVGRANLEKEIQEAGLNLKSDTDYQKMYIEATGQLLQLMLQRISWNEALAKITIETNRIKIVAKKEEMDTNIEIDALDGIWALETYTYGANMLGAISGGTSMNAKPGKAASAIGGAMSGAATGAMIGSAVAPGIGTGIGAAIGGAAGLLGGLFS
jgi:hypothetical protein